jgi:hypothetical protein
MSRVQIDTERGEALLGTVRVEIAPRDNGLEIGGAHGPVLAGISFGRRLELVNAASESSQPHDALAALVLEASTVRLGSQRRAC